MDTIEHRRREVHDTLLPVLAEHYGDKLRVISAHDADNGAVKYGFQLGNSACDVLAVTVNERAAAVRVCLRLGRCYVGYRRASLWLACNRAGNTAAHCASEEQLASRELWVSSHRVTLPGDADGIREQLRDVEVELERIATGMVWFPQLLDGARLAELEEAAPQNEALAAILAQPQSFLQWVAENRSEALENWSVVPADVLGWLGRWEERLAFLDGLYSRFSEELEEANRIGYLMYRLHTLGQLNRHEDVLTVCDELESLSPDWKAAPRAVVPRMWALCVSGQPEEALELAKSAVYDSAPRVWYWRSIAQASLGKYEDGFGSLMKYEALIGQDIIARRNFRRIIPENWQSEEAAA